MPLLRIIVFLLLGASAGAQILEVKLIDEKVERKYKVWLSNMKGRYVLWGELKSGVKAEPTMLTRTGKFVELWVLDPANPGKLPYTIDASGEKVPAYKNAICKIPIEHMAVNDSLKYFLRDQTLPGLVSEYKLRRDAADAVRAERDKHKKATKDWFAAQRRLLNALDRLRAWMEGGVFPRAANDLQKEIAAEQKLLNEDAVAERAAAAKASVEKVEVPEALVAASQAITGGKIKFKCFQSQHIRMTTMAHTMEDVAAKRLLELGETIIEGFRREFCDPYAEDGEDGEAVSDETPDGIFAEIFFGPDDQQGFENFYTEYYGGNWGTGAQREMSLKMSGHPGRGLLGFTYNHYWRTNSESDFEGMVAHGLGHNLKNIHFDRGVASNGMDFLAEGIGYYCSFEYLGRNTVTCKQLKIAEYDKPAGVEGVKTVQEGQRAAFNDLALRKGAPLSKLMLKDLAEMEDADLAKGWSFFDYLAHQEGRRAVLWLRSACFESRKKDGMINRLRPQSEQIYGLKEGEVDFYTWLDERWAAFAKSGQKKDASTRKR